MKRRGQESSYSLTELARLLAAMDNPAEVEAFLDDLCTPAELEALTDRWLVVPLLREGKSYRKVHEESGVSVTTIGRVARHLAGGAGGYERALEITAELEAKDKSGK